MGVQLQQPYSEMVEANLHRLKAIARSYADPQSREDLLQEILYQLWKSFESFEGGGSDKTLAMGASLQQQLLKVQSESRFYGSVATSILAPLGIGVVLILISTDPTLIMSTFQLGVFIAIAYWAHRFNQRHITNNLKPLEDELERDLQRLA